MSDTVNKPSKKKTKTDKPKNLALLLSCISLIALIAYAASAWQYQARTHARLNAQQQTLATLGDSVTSLNNNVTALSQRLTTQDELMQKVAAHTMQDQQTWILREVDYLVHVARYNVLIMKNPEVALALLQTAKTRLAHLTEPNLFTLKQHIVNDIAALKAVPKINLESLLQQLNAIDTQIDSLSLNKPKLKAKQNAQPASKTQASNWRENLLKTWNELKHVIIIRHNPQAITPLLAPNQQAYLLQNLHLYMQQAKWAVLQKQDGIYHDELKQMIALLKQHFNADARSDSLIKMLNLLTQAKLSPQLPDLADSIRALNQLSTAAHMGGKQ